MRCRRARSQGTYRHWVRSKGRSAQIEVVDLRYVACDNCMTNIIWHVAQTLLHDALRIGKRRLGVGVVVAPAKRLESDGFALAYPEIIVLKAAEHISPPELAWPLDRLESRVPGVPLSLEVGVVDAFEEERNPPQLVLDHTDLEAGLAVEHSREDHVAYGNLHPEFAHREVGRPDTGHVWIDTAGAYSVCSQM